MNAKWIPAVGYAISSFAALKMYDTLGVLLGHPGALWDVGGPLTLVIVAVTFPFGIKVTRQRTSSAAARVGAFGFFVGGTAAYGAFAVISLASEQFSEMYLLPLLIGLAFIFGVSLAPIGGAIGWGIRRLSAGHAR
jgi:hypothetical protein